MEDWRIGDFLLASVDTFFTLLRIYEIYPGRIMSFFPTEEAEVLGADL